METNKKRRKRIEVAGLAEDVAYQSKRREAEVITMLKLIEGN